MNVTRNQINYKKFNQDMHIKKHYVTLRYVITL